MAGAWNGQRSNRERTENWKKIVKKIGAPKCPSKSSERSARWGQRDLNPRQRVSTTEGATFRGINESSLQLIINCQQTHFQSLSITGARQSARLAYTPGVSVIASCNHFLRIFAALFLLLIFFLRHFQRWLPRFFQARELLFIVDPSLNVAARHASLAGPPGFEPGASGLEGQRYILAKPRAHSSPPFTHLI